MGQVIEYERHLDTGGAEKSFTLGCVRGASELPTLWLLTHYWKSRCALVRLTFHRGRKNLFWGQKRPVSLILPREVAMKTSQQIEPLTFTAFTASAAPHSRGQRRRRNGGL